MRKATSCVSQLLKLTQRQRSEMSFASLRCINETRLIKENK